ncbi:MAG: tetratricopeptide repeat protein [Janthinobacterium lividum]
MQPKIFLSYSWGNTQDADLLDEDWKKIGIRLIRDVRDAKYKQNLRQFMQRVHESDYVLLFISKSYLQSQNCMYEALEVFEDPAFADKILPIITDDAKLYDPLIRLAYIEHWRARASEIDKSLKRMRGSSALAASVTDDLRQVTKIANSIDAFADAIRVMRYASWPAIKDQGYAEIFKHIGYDPSEQEVLEECSRIVALDDTEDQENALALLQVEHSESVHVMFTESTIAYNEGKYKKTRRILDSILTAYPNFELAYFNLGIILERHLEDYGGARQAFSQAIQLNPSSSNNHGALGDLLEKRFQDYESARACYEQAIIVNPQDDKAHHTLALLLSEKLGDCDTARYHYEQAIALNPQHRYHYNYAVMLGRNLSDFIEARNQYTCALALNPGHYKSHNNLAINLEIHFKEYDKARYHFERAIEVGPNHEEAHHNLGVMLAEKLQDYAEARRHYEAVLQINPAYPTTHGYYALLLDEQFGEYELAREHYERALEFTPHHIPIRQRLSQILEKRYQDYIGSRYQLEQVLNYRADKALDYYNLAIACTRGGDFKAARQHYEKAIEIDAIHDASYRNLGRLLDDQLQDPNGARRLYEQALAILPDSARLHQDFGLMLQQKYFKEYELARQHLERALELDSKSAANYFNLGSLIYEYFDDPVLANQYFDRALEAEPNGASCHLNSAVILMSRQEVEKAQEQYAQACALDPQYKTAEHDEIFQV